MNSCLIVIDAQESFRHRPYFDGRNLPAYLGEHVRPLDGLAARHTREAA